MFCNCNTLRGAVNILQAKTLEGHVEGFISKEEHDEHLAKIEKGFEEMKVAFKAMESETARLTRDCAASITLSERYVEQRDAAYAILKRVKDAMQDKNGNSHDKFLQVEKIIGRLDE